MYVHPSCFYLPAPRRRRRRKRKRHRREEWRPAFLDALRRTGHVGAAARAAGVNRRTAYHHRLADRRFAVAWAEARYAFWEESVARANARHRETSPRVMSNRQLGRYLERARRRAGRPV